MFEAAEIKHKVDNATYKREEPRLREALLKAEFALGDQKPFEVVIVLAGLAGAGKGETLAMINEWMDPRSIETVDCDDPTDEERERPYMWRYWRSLPPKGRLGLFPESWYQEPMTARIDRKMTRPDLDQRLAEIRRGRVGAEVLAASLEEAAEEAFDEIGRETRDAVARHQGRLEAAEAL
jgi:AMP-polyphosphate phosphotransferase